VVDPSSTIARPRAVARILADDDNGFTIIEVMVAMMIFALIFLGVAYSTVTTLRMTADTVSREAAANLAAAEIDAVRQLGDPFLVRNASYTKTLDGTDYTVKRKTGWVSASGSTEGCGTGTGTLQYKRVNVAVSWRGQLMNASVARADTILAPKTRLNDPSYGSILVSVLGANGEGAGGIAVEVTPVSGGSALAEQPPATDSDGCSFAFLVSPGSYKVKVTRPGYVDTTQSMTPETSIAVAAGGAAAASFQYDAEATYSLSYGSAGEPAPRLPDSLSTTFFSSSGVFTRSGAPASVRLHPFASGYSSIAGQYVAQNPGMPSCVSVDPSSWPEATVNGKNLAPGARQPQVAAAPGGTASLTVPMGRIEVQASSATMRIVSAATPLPVGDPGCVIATTHTYSSLPTSGTVTLAAPFGSWRLEEGAGADWIPVDKARVQVPTNAAGMIVAGDVLTVDPRELAP
jgi:prepilin-type N-terminal cleavage/methylation domain-containing protein